jgi:pimeloyl-ACP methyl ester carboxylesterase
LQPRWLLLRLYQDPRAGAALVFSSLLDDEMFEMQASASFADYANLPGYRIGVPLLLLRGARDRYAFLLSSAPKWAKRDGGEFVVVPDAGHNAGQDNPGFVNARLMGLLGQVAWMG